MNSLKSFAYMLAIAETNSISEAAETLGIAQSALSRYILKLENELGVELLDRKSLPILLTEAGRSYAEAGRQILDIDRQLEKRLDDLRNDRNTEIRVGTGPSRAPALLPPILYRFAKAYPGVRVRTDECRTAELVQRLLQGKLDLIITFLDDATAQFQMEPLFEETVSLAVPKGLEQNVQAAIIDGAVDIQRLSVPFVSLHEGQQLRNALDILSGGKAKPLYDSDYLESAMALVDQEIGVTLVPSYWKMLERNARVSYFPIVIPETLSKEDKNRLMSIIHRQVCIFYRKEQFLSEAERAYIASAKEACLVLKEGENH